MNKLGRFACIGDTKNSGRLPVIPGQLEGEYYERKDQSVET